MTPRVRVRSRPDRRLLQLFYVDPVSKKERTKSADTDDPAQAERSAERWQQDLEKSGRIGGRITLWNFRDRFYDEYLPQVAKKTRKGYKTAINNLLKHVDKNTWLHDVDGGLISQVQSKWRASGMKDTSIATHLRHLDVIFGWAKSPLKLIREKPEIRYPRIVQRRLQRGRALTDKEVKAMEKCTVPAYARLIRGIWLSGLRLNEAVALSWDSPPIRVDMDSGRYPRMIIHGEGQKSRKDEIIPLTPDFSAFLRKTPAKQRMGKVFPLPIASLDKIGQAISEAGEKAVIIVNDDGKFASAQDLRSTFGTRWKRKVHPMTLKLMMRHRDISTTMRFYVDDDADEAAEEIWNCTAECTETASKNGKHGRSRPHKHREKMAVGRR